MSARDELFGYVQAGAEEGDLPSFASTLDRYRNEVLLEVISLARISEDVAGALGNDDRARMAGFIANRIRSLIKEVP